MTQEAEEKKSEESKENLVYCEKWQSTDSMIKK